MKKYHEFVGRESAAWVVLRALYLKSRGRRPVDCFGLERNPRRALKVAQKELATEGRKFFATTVPCDLQTLENLLRFLGFNSLNKKRVEVPIATRYTFQQWGMTLPLKAETK